MVPSTSACVSPVIAVPGPGLTPTSPVMEEVGTSLTPAPANTAKGVAAPNCTLVAADAAGMKAALSRTNTEHAMPATDSLDRRLRADWGGMPVGEWRRALDGRPLVEKRVV